MRKLNNRINEIHKRYERAQRLTYNNNHSSFRELLKRGNSMRIHYRNLHSFTIEISKVKNDIAPLIMKEITENPHITLRPDLFKPIYATENRNH